MSSSCCADRELLVPPSSRLLQSSFGGLSAGDELHGGRRHAAHGSKPVKDNIASGPAVSVYRDDCGRDKFAEGMWNGCVAQS